MDPRPCAVAFSCRCPRSVHAVTAQHDSPPSPDAKTTPGGWTIRSRGRSTDIFSHEMPWRTR